MALARDSISMEAEENDMKKIDWDAMYPLLSAVFTLTIIAQAADFDLFEQIMLALGFGGMVGTLMRYSRIEARRHSGDRPDA